MSDLKRFNLPDVGEGLTEAEIVTWKVKVGEAIKVNDVIVEIETAKSLVELPSPFAGVVAELLVAEGDTVLVGAPIIAVETGTPQSGAPAPRETAEPASEAEVAVPTPQEDEAVEPGLIGGPAPGGRTSVLVGYGPRTTDAKRRPRKNATPAEISPAAAQAGVQHAFTPHATEPPTVDISEAEQAAPAEQLPSSPAAAGGHKSQPLAKPPVRKLAKDLGVDLSQVTGSGPNATVTREDVENAAGATSRLAEDVSVPREQLAGADPGWFAFTPLSPTWDGDWPDGHTQETRIPVKGVRKLTAQAMVASAFTAPHVTEWITIDATRTMKMVRRLKSDRNFASVSVSPLLVVARAVCLAIRRTPEVNASWDEQSQEIVFKHYVNLGIAVATPRGLIVPNIKDAEQLPSSGLAARIGELATVARAGKTPPADQAGGTFTITNVGVFGVDSGTPIINPGEAAILCMGAIRRQPWVIANQVKPRWVTTLAVSFDHRMVDGAQGSKFLADVASIVEDPGSALLF